MNRESHDDTVLTLVKLFVGLCLFMFVMVLSGDTFKSLFSGPTFSDEELLAMTAERKRLRNKARLDTWDLVEDGIHVNTGLKDDENLTIIIQSCLTCHSAKLITQNRASRQGWQDMIHWMQETQGLRDLGKYEPMILDYLSTHYAPQKIGRRQNLNIEEIEWYVLNLDGDHE